MNQFKTVFAYEYGQYMKNKVFMGFTIIIAVLIALFLTLPPLFSEQINGAISGSGEPERSNNLLMVDSAGLFDSKEQIEQILKSYNVTLAAEGSPDDAGIREKISGGEYDCAFFISSANSYTYLEKSSGLSSEYMAQEIYEAVNTQYKFRLYEQAGLSDSQIESLMTLPQLSMAETESGGADAYIYTYVLLMLLYMSILLYGQFVATSVVTEKSSRAMELLITSAKPNNLIFGKILGTGTAGLTQISIWLLTIVLFYNINSGFWSQYEIVGHIFNMPVDIMIFTIVFYILGFFMFAAIYGALGSLVSRVEDLNTVSAPVIICVLIGFFGAFAAMAVPDSIVAVIMSYIPVFTPMVMFVRICVSDVSAIGIGISIVLTAVTAIGAGALASKIYRIGVLMYGQRPSIKELFSALKKEKAY